MRRARSIDAFLPPKIEEKIERSKGEIRADVVHRDLVAMGLPKTMATATVDRLMHHAHLVGTSGESHRLAEGLAGRGVIPLATKPDPN